MYPSLPSSYVVGDDFELRALLPPSPQCWELWVYFTSLAYTVLGMDPRVACMLGKCSTSFCFN